MCWPLNLTTSSVTPVKREKKKKTGQLPMVTEQPTQTAGNRRGDPIRGAVKKGRHWLEAGRGQGMVLELTPPTYWTCPAAGYFSPQVEWLPADSERVTCRSAVSQDQVIFNLFMTCQYRHQGKVTVTVARSSLWVCTWEPVNTSWQMTCPPLLNPIYQLWVPWMIYSSC